MSFIAFVIIENDTFLNVFQPLCSISNRLWKRSSESPNHGVLKVVEGKQYSQVLLLQMVRMHNQWTPFHCVYSVTQPIQLCMYSNFFCLWPKSVHPKRVYWVVVFAAEICSVWYCSLLPTVAKFLADCKPQDHPHHNTPANFGHFHSSSSANFADYSNFELRHYSPTFLAGLNLFIIRTV